MIKAVVPASLASTLFAAMVLAGATGASAQSAGITEHKLDPKAAQEAFGGGAPVGPFQSRLPLVDKSVFETPGSDAGISGNAGVSARSGAVATP